MPMATDGSNCVLVDPTSSEESLASNTITVTYDLTGKLCGVDMLGGRAIPLGAESSGDAGNGLVQSVMALAKDRAVLWGETLQKAVDRRGIMVTDYVSGISPSKTWERQDALT